jgi:hypothetical protein
MAISMMSSFDGGWFSSTTTQVAAKKVKKATARKTAKAKTPAADK